jgi:hypothetical protein
MAAAKKAAAKKEPAKPPKKLAPHQKKLLPGAPSSAIGKAVMASARTMVQQVDKKTG